MRAVSSQTATGKQRKPVSTQAKKQKPEITSRPADDAPALSAGGTENPIASKFKIAALYIASGSAGFLIPFAQAASKVLSHAAACSAAMAAAAEGSDSDVLVGSDDSSEVASSETTSSWVASSMPSSESSNSSETASSMPSTESSDSSETASSMPSSEENEEAAAPQQGRKLVRRHVRTGSQPNLRVEHMATAVQNLVTQDL